MDLRHTKRQLQYTMRLNRELEEENHKLLVWSISVRVGIHTHPLIQTALEREQTKNKKLEGTVQGTQAINIQLNVCALDCLFMLHVPLHTEKIEGHPVGSYNGCKCIVDKINQLDVKSKYACGCGFGK